MLDVNQKYHSKAIAANRGSDDLLDEPARQAAEGPTGHPLVLHAVEAPLQPPPVCLGAGLCLVALSQAQLRQQ